ncbi:MAG TPA: hypothetical protein VFO16_21100 [Pseudonocardiaceae bacterium]|nr:hypothetical protein [Pseudonocardiaceae bacterium]
MTHQQMLIVLIVGVGLGMVYGRWRHERLKARAAARKAWRNFRERDGWPSKTWRPF